MTIAGSALPLTPRPSFTEEDLFPGQASTGGQLYPRAVAPDLRFAAFFMLR